MGVASAFRGSSGGSVASILLSNSRSDGKSYSRDSIIETVPQKGKDFFDLIPQSAYNGLLDLSYFQFALFFLGVCSVAAFAIRNAALLRNP
jgi:hypothetical protein